MLTGPRLACGQLDAADHFFALATRVQGSAPAAAQAHFRDRYGWSDPSSRLASTPGPAGALGSVSLGYRPRVLTLPDPDRIEVVETGLPHFAIRGGWGGHTGIVGAGLEVHPWGKHFGLAVGTGTYLVTGGFAFTFAETFARSGVYLDLHGALVRPGLVGPKVGSGVGAGATHGYDFRPEPWLSIKTGLGVGKNTASQPSDQARLLIFDLNLGVVF